MGRPSSTDHHRSVNPADPAARVRADLAAPGVQDPADRVDPADQVDQVSRADQATGTAATGREVTSPVAPEDTNQVAQVAQVGRAATTRVGPADLATPAGTIPEGPEVTTQVGLGDMIRGRPGAPSLAVRRLADLVTPGDTIPAGRAVLDRMPGRRDRMPVHRPLTAELPLRTRARLHLTPAGRRWEPIPQPEVAATRPADRTLRLEAIRPVAATPERK
jgi:hypothetical protein